MAITQYSAGLGKLNLLLEATSLLHSQLPLESVLAAMLDHTIAITHADRGLLIEPSADNSFRVRLARGKAAKSWRRKALLPARPRLARQSTAKPPSSAKT